MPRGISTAGDLVRVTVDGQDLGAMWREFQATLDVRNQARDNLLGLLTFRTTAAADQIAQTTDEFDLEKASELGLPTATAKHLPEEAKELCLCSTSQDVRAVPNRAGVEEEQVVPFDEHIDERDVASNSKLRSDPHAYSCPVTVAGIVPRGPDEN